MRYIRTTNNQIEFIEANDEGKILNSIGLQLGEVYFQIKNGKVAFYLNDSEKPFDNFIWSMNLPITIDGEEYEDEDEVSAVLHNIMNDRFQEQLDELREGLAAESARAQEAEEQLDDKIEEETARAISAETHLQTEVTELSGLVSTFDERITRCEETVSALSEDLNDEITRSTAKDAEHDTAISGLTTSLNNEITRATSAETILHNEILAENTRATAAESALDSKIDNETDRATSAETALNTKVDAEILRSTNKDTQHDNLISALTENLNDEVERAQNAESALTNALNSEIQRAISAETELHNEILAEKNRALAAESGITSNLNAEIQNRIADVDAEETRALAAESALTDALNAEITRSTSKDASHDSEISGLTTSLQNEINRAVGAENSLRNDLNSEISARTSADAAQLQRITALEVGKADANNVYTKAESDAKYATKEYISGMTDNYYTKSEVDSALSAKADTSLVETISGNVVTLSGEVQTISGNVLTSGDVQTQIDKSISGKQDTLIAGENITISGNVISASGGGSITIDPSLNSGSTNAVANSAITNAINAVKLDAATINAFEESTNPNLIGFSLASVDGRISSSCVPAYVGDGLVKTYTRYLKVNFTSGITSASTETQVPSAKVVYDELQNKQNTLSAGTGIDITNDVISVTGGSTPVDAYTKAESDARFQQKLTAGSGISIVNNVISATGGSSTLDVAISGGTDDYHEAIIFNNPYNVASGTAANAFGVSTKAYGGMSIAVGTYTEANAFASFAGGDSAKTNSTAAESFAYGQDVETKNIGEAAFGIRNKSSREVNGTSEVASGSTLFSVGNPHSIQGRDNALEIRKDDSIYIVKTPSLGTRDVVRLQDYLTSSADVQTQISNSISGKTNQSDFSAHTADTTIHVTTAQTAAWDAKQNPISAGTNVQINNNVISATDTTYTAGDGISISNQNVISTTTKFWCGTQAQYDAISVKDPNTVYMIHD